MKTGLLAVYLIFILASCYPPSALQSTAFQFPLSAGNRWNYTRTILITNFKPLIPNATFQDIRVSYPSSVTIEGMTQLTGVTVWKFRLSEQEMQSFTGYAFYQVDHDTLFSRAYKSPTTVAPAEEVNKAVRYKIAGMTFSSVREMAESFRDGFPRIRSGNLDSLTYESGPVKSFVYPLVPGEAWDYRTSDYPPGWRIHKTVRSTTTFTVENVIVHACRIHADYDMNGDGAWDSTLVFDEVVGAAGILDRKFSGRLIVTTEENPEGIGTADYFDEYFCTSLSVKSFSYR